MSTTPVVKTPAWIITNTFILVTVKNMYLISEEEIEVHGTYTTGDAAYDRELAEATRTVPWNPTQMANALAQDIDFNLVEPRDSMRIYRMVVNLIKHWEDMVVGSITPPPVPTEELLKLNVLAEKMFAIARCFEEFADEIQPRIARLGVGSRFGRAMAKNNQETRIKTLHESEHSSDTVEGLVKRAVNRRKAWDKARKE